jgi:D-sedoheptulose 7-phosphate isomerase
MSTSSTRGNGVDAFLAARELGVKTIGVTGQSGGRLAALSDLLIAAPHGETNHIQEAHIAIGHLICALTEAALCSSRP